MAHADTEMVQTSEPTLTELMGQVATESQGLLKAEAARVEFAVREQIEETKRALLFGLIAATFMLVGTVGLSGAAYLLLSRSLQDEILASAIVGGGAWTAGALLALVARRIIRPRDQP